MEHPQQSSHQHAHGHMWLVGVLGIAAGIFLMIYVPSLEAVSRVLFLFAGFHIAGGLVLLGSLYVMFGQRVAGRSSRLRRVFGRAAAAGIDFGWAPGWTVGPLIAALVALAGAAALAVTAPGWWPLAIALALLAASFFAGFLFTSASARSDSVSLPMVGLFAGNDDVVLDAGCGAGRTTIAVGRALRNGRIVSLDRFDSDYIESGGRPLLEKNLGIAGLSDRVRIEPGDLTALPFAEATFDSAVSAHAIDHLGPQKELGLSQVFKVLKPGGRFLLVVWVPGWAMFAVVNILSFFLTGKAGWRIMARRVGFEIVEDGNFNGVWFMLLQRPAAA